MALQEFVRDSANGVLYHREVRRHEGIRAAGGATCHEITLVGRPVVFISHSSEDSVAARAIAESLRQRGINPWVDHEQIGPGDSILGRIEEGILDCDVILVLISESFVKSRWCRAEYEPLLIREIESGRTLVIPVRLDDAEIPALLSAKRYTDLRYGIGGAAMRELAESILDGRSAAVVRRLLPGRENTELAGYECSLLSMIISKVINDYPIAVISREKILRGRSILDLYQTVETLIIHYEDLCDEIIDLLVDADVEHHFYGSAYHISPRRIQRTNRRLLDIANDMRDIARSLDGIIEARNPFHRRFVEVLKLCTQISVVEDFLLIRLGAPPVLPNRPVGYDAAMGLRSADGLLFDNAHSPVCSGELGQQMISDLEKVLGELNTYKVQLRSAVAATREKS
jgi:TIR domain